jgi:RNA polymerase sigma-70 factor, ECF subfamily
MGSVDGCREPEPTVGIVTMLTLEPRSRTVLDRSGDPEPAAPPGAKAVRRPPDTTPAGCALHCARLCTEDGLARAYAAHANELTGYCRRALADHGLAEEITQEVFLRAWRRCDSFAFRHGSAHGGATQIRTWLFAIARNAVIDAARRRGRRPALHQDPEQVGQQADPSDTYARIDTVDQVRGGLAELTPSHRAVLTAIFVDELTYEEAADRFGIPIGTVKSRIYYALRALRAQLGADARHGR